MLTLALEFSSERRSAALILSGRVLGEAEETGIRNSDPRGLIRRVLEGAGRRAGEVEKLAVDLGPGSYAGIRMGLAFAQGWQLGRGIPVVGVGSMDVLAAGMGEGAGLGRVGLVVDAQRGEFYLAIYRWGAAGWTVERPVALVSAEALERERSAGLRLAGPAAAMVDRAAVPKYPGATDLGRVGEGLNGVSDASQLAPIYLRETQFVKAGARSGA